MAVCENVCTKINNLSNLGAFPSLSVLDNSVFIDALLYSKHQILVSTYNLQSSLLVCHFQILMSAGRLLRCVDEIPSALISLERSTASVSLVLLSTGTESPALVRLNCLCVCIYSCVGGRIVSFCVSVRLPMFHIQMFQELPIHTNNRGFYLVQMGLAPPQSLHD